MAKKKGRGKGEGTITQRADGRWMGRATAGRTEAGKQRRITIYRPTEEAVIADLADITVGLRGGGYVPPSDITVGQWLDTWLRVYAAPTIRPATWRSYESNIRVHLRPVLGHIQLRDLLPSHIQQLLNERIQTRSARTVELIHTVLHTALRQAVLEQLVTRNVAQAVRKPKKEGKERRVLSVAEQDSLLMAAAEERLGAAYVVLLGTGLRVGELCALRWSDVDLKGRTLRVAQTAIRVRTPNGPRRTGFSINPPKTASGRRTIPLAASVASTLAEWKLQQNTDRVFLGKAWKQTEYVFTSRDGTLLDPANINRTLDRITKRAGITHVNVHALRHTFATRLLESGVPAKTVQVLLGHSTVTLTLDIYAHVMPDTSRAAVDLIDATLRPKSAGVK
jgi:integrase